MIKDEKYIQPESFPEPNLLSFYNLSILFHFLGDFTLLIRKGRYSFFKHIIQKILKFLSNTPEEEIRKCLEFSLKERKLGNIKKLQFLKSGLIYPILLYYVVRTNKPDIVIETGVHSGRSTSFILMALSDNKKGKLYSIDLGHDVQYQSESGSQEATLPQNLKIGWLIPDELKSRWKLILGDSKRELPKLLEQLETIDVFSHDGEHTDANMRFEYNLAIKYLKKGGILLSDDVLFGQNNAPKTGNLKDVDHYKGWLDLSEKYSDCTMINYKVGYLQKK